MEIYRLRGKVFVYRESSRFLHRETFRRKFLQLETSFLIEKLICKGEVIDKHMLEIKGNDIYIFRNYLLR